MARLPQAADLQRRPTAASTPDVRAPGVDYSPLTPRGGDPVARGVAEIGKASQVWGAAIEARQDEVDDFETRRRLADFKLATEMDLERARRDMAEGGVGYAAGWEQRFKEQAARFVGERDANIPESQRAKVGLALKAHETMLAERARRDELAERDRTVLSNLEATVGKYRSRVEADPAAHNDSWREINQLIELSPLLPEARDAYRKKAREEIGMAAGLALAERATTAQGRDAARAVLAPDGVTPAGARRPRASPMAAHVETAIAAAAERHGIDPELMRTVARIESSGDPTATRGSYQGLFQLSEEEFRRGGGAGSRYDVSSNAMAAAAVLKQKIAAFEQRHGRPPTGADLYLMHQQGEAGFAAHTARPDAPAWQNMLSTGEGRQKGEAWARRAIWDNIPDSDKARFGSVENVTSQQFMDLWRQRVDASGPLGHLPPARLRELWSRAEQRYAQEAQTVQGLIKAQMEASERGVLPPEDWLRVMAPRVEALADPTTSAQYATMLGKARVTEAFRALPPAVQQREAVRQRAEIAAGGGTAEQDKYVQHIERLAADSITQARDNAIGWASRVRPVVPISDGTPPVEVENARDRLTWADNYRHGQQLIEEGRGTEAAALYPHMFRQVEFQPLNFGGQDLPQQLEHRMQTAAGVARYTGNPIQAFAENERQELVNVLKKGGQPMLVMLGNIAQAANRSGADASMVLKQLSSRDAPELAMVGHLVANQGDPQLLKTMAEAMRWKLGQGEGFQSTINRTQAQPSLGAYAEVFKGAPTAVDSLRTMANLVYEYESRQAGHDPATFKQDLYTDIVSRLMGARKDAVTGLTYGGVGGHGDGWGFAAGAEWLSPGTWTDGKSASKVVVPAGVRNDSFDALLGALRADDLARMGRIPVDRRGNPYSMSELRNMTWESVGPPGAPPVPGLYLLRQGTDRQGNPVYALDGTGPRARPIIIDLRPALEDMRRRKPEIFQGYRPGLDHPFIEPEVPAARPRTPAAPNSIPGGSNLGLTVDGSPVAP